MAVPTIDAAMTVLTESRAAAVSLPAAVALSAVVSTAVMGSPLCHSAGRSSRDGVVVRSDVLPCGAQRNGPPRLTQGPRTAMMSREPCRRWRVQACMPNQSANDDGIIIRADATACIVIPFITASLLSAMFQISGPHPARTMNQHRSRPHTTGGRRPHSGHHIRRSHASPGRWIRGRPRNVSIRGQQDTKASSPSIRIGAWPDSRSRPDSTPVPPFSAPGPHGWTRSPRRPRSPATMATGNST